VQAAGFALLALLLCVLSSGDDVRALCCRCGRATTRLCRWQCGSRAKSRLQSATPTRPTVLAAARRVYLWARQGRGKNFNALECRPMESFHANLSVTIRIYLIRWFDSRGVGSSNNDRFGHYFIVPRHSSHLSDRVLSPKPQKMNSLNCANAQFGFTTSAPAVCYRHRSSDA
jgi:hypothetical protein